MVMEQVQVRMSKGILKRVDKLVKQGLYANRSDVIRDGARRLVIEDLMGIIPNTGDSVKEVREIRKKLSKEIRSWKDVKKLNELMK